MNQNKKQPEMTGVFAEKAVDFIDFPMNLALQKLKSQKNSPMRGVLLNQMNPQKAADIESPAFVSLLFILTTWDTRLMSCRK